MNIQTRQTSEGIASALYRQQVEEADRICDEFARQFWPMIGTANQCAYLAMDEAVDAMIEAGMMRHQVKVKAMKALQEFEKYDKAVRKHFNDFADDRYYLWADMTSRQRKEQRSICEDSDGMCIDNVGGIDVRHYGRTVPAQDTDTNSGNVQGWSVDGLRAAVVGGGQSNI